MKKIIVLALIFAMLITFTSEAAYGEVFYKDTYNHWSASDVDYATNVLKVFNGYSDYTFKPDEKITRGEFITILVRTGLKLGKIGEVYSSDLKYDDLDFSKWYYTYVVSFYEYMKNNFNRYRFYDVFKGSDFNGDAAITREEAVALVAVLCGESIFDNEISFSDVKKDYKFYRQVRELYNNKIIIGYSDNTVKLNKNITRGESAALIRRVHDVVNAQNIKVDLSVSRIPIKGEDVLSFFGAYNFKTNNDSEKKYIVAKNTLEQLSFYGYIFPEEEHLYDKNPIETLKLLRSNGFPNKAGVNYYLLKFGELSNEENIDLGNEILEDIIKRNDLCDIDLTQLFEQVVKYNCSEELFLKALRKWYETASNSNIKFNVGTFAYNYYMNNGKNEKVKSMIYTVVKDKNKFASMTNINWNSPKYEDYNFLDFENINFQYTSHMKKEYNQKNDNPQNENVSILKNIVLVDDIKSNIDISSIGNEVIFYYFSLNKTAVLNFIGEYERAFAETLNDYKIMKQTKMYKEKQAEIDSKYLSLLYYCKDLSIK